MPLSFVIGVSSGMTRCAQCVVSSPGASLQRRVGAPRLRQGVATMRAAHAKRKADECYRRSGHRRPVDNRRQPKSPARLLAPRMARRGSPELKCCSSSVSLSPRSARSMTVCPPAESAQRYEGQGQPIHDHDGNEDRPKDMHAGSLPHEQR
jgi:hypothetical protein